jgi:UDP-glucose 4-epimerase
MPRRAGGPRTVQGQSRYTDGTARDYIHVTDLAEAHVLALKAGGRQPGTCSHSGRGWVRR